MYKLEGKRFMLPFSVGQNQMMFALFHQLKQATRASDLQQPQSFGLPCYHSTV